VSFFLLGRNAFAEGVGEVLTPLDLAPAWYVVITPQVAVSTREIFASNALTRNTKPLKITAFFAGQGRNDLEAETCRRYPQVARALEWLKAFGDARMSGSGSSVFAAFGSESEARAVAARIPGAWRGVAVRGLDRHPLAPE
jgi:4-diphosphocytidyl-2-C-methyl-D-erythritol kinase